MPVLPNALVGRGTRWACIHLDYDNHSDYTRVIGFPQRQEDPILWVSWLWLGCDEPGNLCEDNKLGAMTDQDKADPWAALASELGVDATTSKPEEETQAAPPAPAAAPAPPPAPKVAPRKPPERVRSTSDWDALASELGIPPESLPREQPALPREQHALPREQPAPIEIRHEEPILQEDRQEEEPATQPEPCEPLSIEPSIFGEEAGGFAETVDLMEDTTEFTERAAGTAESPAESEEQRTSRRRRKRRRRGRGASRADATQPPAAEPSELELPAASEELPVADVAEDQSVAGDAVASEVPGVEAGAEERSGRRRSRRSGRRRKRRPEGTETREETAGEPESDAGEAHPPRDFRPEPSEFAPRDDADDDSADEYVDEGDDDKELRVGHRAIPTWDEAVGLIIAANLESRAKRPSSGQSRGHGGRDRRGGQRRPPRGN